MFEVDVWERSFHYSGREVVRLMRTNGVTIRELAARMQLSQKLIRRFRADGVCGHTACCVYESITGSLTPRMRAAYMSREKNWVL